MQGQPISSPQFSDIDYICIATDLLTKMMSELQSLEFSSWRLTLAMATAAHDLRQWLHTLAETVELLTSTQDAVRSAELSRRAISLIYQLAEELEQLAYQAERDSRQAAAGCYLE
jgi:hypothetical protein